MKIAILASANSIHTQRWVGAMAQRGHDVTLLSQHRNRDSDCGANVNVEYLPYGGNLGYFANAVRLRARLVVLRPDILNVHYASGYGTTAAFAGFRPTLLSVWGSDVFEFPFESWWKGVLLRHNLRRATRLASTSRVMARQLQTLVPDLPPAYVTPFGVDCDRFRPDSRHDPRFITIGTVKSLAPAYGIDLLILAFARLLNDPQLQAGRLAPGLRLMLVGGGNERSALEALVDSLGLRERVVFVGPVPHGDVPSWLNHFDVYVAASRLESFGVAAVEASACGVPVVVSDAGGLPEVVQDGVTGFVVPREDPIALAAAIKQLVLDKALRQRVGDAGRQFVLSTYKWEHCVDIMEAAYRDVIAASRSKAARRQLE